MSIDEYFAARPPGDRAIFEAVMAALEGATETIVEPVSIGILFKRRGTFAELRPRRAGMRLGFASATRLTDDRITSTQRASRTSHRYWHGALITSPEGVDQKVRGWLARAYEAAGG